MRTLPFIISDQLRLSVLNGELWVGVESGKGITFKDAAPVISLLIAFCHPIRFDQAPESLPMMNADDVIMICRLLADVGVLQIFDSRRRSGCSSNLFADMRRILDLSDHPCPSILLKRPTYLQEIAFKLAELCLEPVLEPSMDSMSALVSKHGINLGCGTQPIPNWFNVDLNSERADLKWDLRRPLPFSNNSVMRINCAHVLEHLDPDAELPSVLKEMVRILKPGGRIRVVVPDALAWMRAYCEADEDFFKCVGQQMGIDWCGADRIRRLLTYLGLRPDFFSTGHHRMGYDYTYLSEVLIEHSFKYVRKCSYNSSTDMEFRIDHFSRSAQIKVGDCHPSLFVEAHL